jgi:hypothetical protein
MASTPHSSDSSTYADYEHDISDTSTINRDGEGHSTASTEYSRIQVRNALKMSAAKLVVLSGLTDFELEDEHEIYAVDHSASFEPFFSLPTELRVDIFQIHLTDCGDGISSEAKLNDLLATNSEVAALARRAYSAVPVTIQTEDYGDSRELWATWRRHGHLIQDLTVITSLSSETPLCLFRDRTIQLPHRAAHWQLIFANLKKLIVRLLIGAERHVCIDQEFYWPGWVEYCECLAVDFRAKMVEVEVELVGHHGLELVDDETEEGWVEVRKCECYCAQYVSEIFFEETFKWAKAE